MTGWSSGFGSVGEKEKWNGHISSQREQKMRRGPEVFKDTSRTDLKTRLWFPFLKDLDTPHWHHSGDMSLTHGPLEVFWDPTCQGTCWAVTWILISMAIYKLCDNDTSVSISSVCPSSSLMNTLESLIDYELVFGGKRIYIMSNT